MTVFKGNQIGRRIALGGAIDLGAALTAITIDSGIIGGRKYDTLETLARLLDGRRPHSNPINCTMRDNSDDRA